MHIIKIFSKLAYYEKHKVTHFIDFFSKLDPI
jgi:hypothetical protein